MPKLKTRSTDDRRITTRAVNMRAPATLDPEGRALRAVISTEAAVPVWDWERWDVVPEVLIADGMQAPASGQIPLLDSHDRKSVGSVLGSATDFQRATVDGLAGIEAQVSFASTPEAASAFTKFREGHLTDFSIGYAPLERVWIKEGEKGVVAGRTYDGPCYVTTRWSLFELSATPIGADANAKSRAKAPQNKEIQPMNKKLRELLVGLGVSPDATDAQCADFLRALPEVVQASLRAKAEERAASPAPAAAPAPADPAPATDAARAHADQAVRDATERARAEERQRGVDIRDACRAAGLPEMADDLVGRGVPLDQARQAIIAKLGERSQPLAGRIEVGTAERDKVRAAVSDGLCLRAGLKIEKPAPGHEEFRGLSLLEITRECLVRAGAHVRGLGKIDLVGLALRSDITGSTSDLPGIFSNVLGKKMRQAYQEYPSTYQAWCSVTDVSDFKPVSRHQLSEAPSLDLINENGEYTAGKFSESKESYKVQTYGKKFSISRQAIINDDLGAILRIPTAFAVAGARRINDLVYAIVIDNPAMSDGVVLFHANHLNLAGTAAALSVDSLSVGRRAMRTQKGLGGNVINVTPQFLLVPAALETTAEVLLRSVSLPGADMSSGVYNPFANRLTPIVEARLDAASATAWYLTSSPSQIDTVEVAFLDGRREPYIEQQIGFDVDGLEMKARLDVGAKAIDHRGMYKNAGA